MPVYEYTAKNNKGIKIKGCVEADNILAARQVIYQIWITPWIAR